MRLGSECNSVPNSDPYQTQGRYYLCMRENAGQTLVKQLRAASRVTILTGAGVSAASGVPTFRGAGGLWRQFRPEDLATPQAFSRDPRLVWEWYAWRRELIAGCRPNPAHDVIAAWARRFDRCRVVTQNVDDLHVRAGTPNLIRVHGSIWDLRCWSGCGKPSWRDETVPLPILPPTCPECGGLARPGVVWFGESLSPVDLDAAVDACACDVFLTIGTSSVVYPVAGLVHEARRRGAFTAEINLESTPASAEVGEAIQGPADEILPIIDRCLTP
jgi:NAD-dependent deacetylase